ncbi:hypothetical protein [Labilibaculum euxinus]
MKKININVLMLAVAILISSLLLLLNPPKAETLTEVLCLICNVTLAIMGFSALPDILIKGRKS